LSQYAFGHLRLHRVYAYVFGFNERARRAFQKAGFTLEGVLKGDRLTAEGPVDVYLFARLDGGAARP
jgi:RimJ/RimL family protein N-acetyltransferase